MQIKKSALTDFDFSKSTKNKLINPRTFFCYCLIILVEKMPQIEQPLKVKTEDERETL